MKNMKNKIRQAMAENKISNKKLAELLNKKPSRVSQILRAENLQTKTIRELADALNKPISFFFNELEN